MEISLLLMQQIAQLFLILIMGYAVVKVGLLKASDSRVLSVVMVYLVTPCVIINAFQIDDTPEIRKGLLYSMAIAAAIHVVLLVLSALLSRPLKLDAVEQVNVIYSNAAALVIPLVKALMGDAYVIYSCAFIIVQLVLLWTHASSLLQGSSALDWKKVLTNINMIAIAAGALLYWFRVVLPAPLQNTMSTVGNMMGPMGMLLAGMANCRKAAAGGVLHPPQLSAHSAASGGMPAGGSGAAVGLPCIQLGGRRQEHPDDGLPCRHHPCLCYCYLHGSAL